MNDRAPRTRRACGLAGLLVLAAAPASAEPTALTLSVGDGLDGDAVRGRLSTELRMPVVATREGGACELPCLSVTLDGSSATVSFTPVKGPPRARTVELGADPSQWPLVVTLLAGNVVRDEAADVLALLPEPEQPPAEQAVPVVPPAALAELPVAPEAAGPGELPAAAPVLAPGTSPLRAERLSLEPDGPWKLLGFGFVPGLSTDFTQIGRVTHFLSLDLIAGVSGGSTGVTISGIADIERGRVWGLQIAGVTAVARRVAGFQISGVAAVSGALHGVQLAGTAAVADSAEGAQIGGVAAVSRGHADLQIAGVAAAARGRASTQIAGVSAIADGAARIQLAGVAASARGDTNIQGAGVSSVARDANVQVAGVTSVARGTANIQVAGVVNVARRLEGIQIAPINVARRVDGIQIGLINVGSADGFSFGLVNIVPGGRADLEATVDSSRLGTVLFRHGGRRWHNVYGVGGHPVDETGGDKPDDVWMYGLGFGPSFHAGSTIFDLELIGWQINHGARHYDGVSILGQLRLSIAYGLGPFRIVAGGALNGHISTDPESPLVLERRSPGTPMDTREVRVVTWPSAFVGLRI